MQSYPDYQLFQRPLAWINVCVADNPKLAGQLWDLLATNYKESFFLVNGRPIQLVYAESGHIVEPLEVDDLRSDLNEIADFYKTSSEGAAVPAEVHLEVLQCMIDNPPRSLPRLTMLTHHPVFTEAGRLIALPGYDAETGILYKPSWESEAAIPAPIGNGGADEKRRP